MKSRKNKIILAALLGIPTSLILMGSIDSKAAVKGLPTPIKNNASTNIALKKPPLPPNPTNISISKGNVLSKVNSFNKVNSTNKTPVKQTNSSVGQLKLNSKLKSDLEKILSTQTSNNKKPISTTTVGKLNSSSSGKLNSVFGGAGNKGSTNLDLSKLPATPPPPPTSNQTNQSTISTNTTSTQTNIKVDIPDAPPLPQNSSLSIRNPNSTISGSLKEQLNNKVSTGLKKTQNLSLKQPTTNSLQDNLMNELKQKLQSRK